MLIIGITGGLGTGKSTVAALLRKKGCAVIDADSLAKEAAKRRTDTYKKIIKEFGRDILKPNNQIDRKKLAEAVFGSRKRLKKLCSIIHPFVLSRIRLQIRKLKQRGFNKAVIIDAPLLIEAGLRKDVDLLLVVSSKMENQVARSIGRLKINRTQAVKRIKAQMPLSKKESMADFIIDNNGTKAQVKVKVQKIWNTIKSEVKG